MHLFLPAWAAGSAYRGFAKRAVGPLAVALLLTLAAVPARGQEGDEIPPPEDVPLQTKDGVQLGATFYPGTKGKETVPILMLHSYKGSRIEFHELALALQEAGHAVLVPDLRGHGESTMNVAGQKLEAERMNKLQFAAILNDVEACKQFLMERNNLGQLNIDKLTLIGADLGALVAVNFAALDWSWPPLAVGKQGQDVKALILLSPPRNVKGFTLNAGLEARAVQREISILLVTGRKEQAEATRLEKALLAARASLDDKGIYLAKFPTSLEGTKLLGERDLKLTPYIAQFIEKVVVPKPYPWKNRGLP